MDLQMSQRKSLSVNLTSTRRSERFFPIHKWLLRNEEENKKRESPNKIEWIEMNSHAENRLRRRNEWEEAIKGSKTVWWHVFPSFFSNQAPIKPASAFCKMIFSGFPLNGPFICFKSLRRNEEEGWWSRFILKSFWAEAETLFFSWYEFRVCSWHWKTENAAIFCYNHGYTW